jgi:hypothetical protein
LNNKCRTAIQNMNAPFHNFWQLLAKNSSELSYLSICISLYSEWFGFFSSIFHFAMVCMLQSSVFEFHVHHKSLETLLNKILHMIYMKNFNGSLYFILNMCLEVFECIKSFRLILQKIKPCFSTAVIDEGCHNPIMGYSPKFTLFFQNKIQKIK